MAVIGKIDIALRARTGAFDRKMRKSSKSVRGLGRSLKALGRGLLRVGVALAAAAVGAAVGMALLVKRELKAIDAIAKLSARMNVATEDLVALGHAAEITGAGTEVMMKSVEIFVRRLGEVRQGTGEAVRALEKLNLSADDLASRSPAEAIGMVADRMKLLANAADKGVVAYQLFGRAGIKLLNLLDLGSAGLTRMTEEAEKLGITFSRVDAAGVEAANDAITRVKAVLTGVVRTLAIKLAPVIELGAKLFIEWATSGEGAGKKVQDAFEKAAKGVAKLAVALDKLGKGMDLIGLGARLVADGFLELSRMTAESAVFLTTGAIDSPLGGFRKFVDQYHQDTLKLFDELDEKLGAPTTGDAGKSVEGFFKGVEERMAKLRIEMQKTAALRQQQTEIAMAAEAYGKAAEQVDKFNAKLQKQLELFSASQSRLQFRKMQDLVRDVPTAFLDAFNDKLAETARLLSELDKKKAFATQAEQLKKFADRVKDSLKTPIDRFREFRDEVEKAIRGKLLTPGEGLAALENRMKSLMGDKADRGQFATISRDIDVKGLGLLGKKPQVEQQKITNTLLQQLLDVFLRFQVEIPR